MNKYTISDNQSCILYTNRPLSLYVYLAQTQQSFKNLENTVYLQCPHYFLYEKARITELSSNEKLWLLSTTLNCDKQASDLMVRFQVIWVSWGFGGLISIRDLVTGDVSRYCVAAVPLLPAWKRELLSEKSNKNKRCNNLTHNTYNVIYNKKGIKTI